VNKKTETETEKVNKKQKQKKLIKQKQNLYRFMTIFSQALRLEECEGRMQHCLILFTIVCVCVCVCVCVRVARFKKGKIGYKQFQEGYKSSKMKIFQLKTNSSSKIS